ncbi:COP9 signalosome complex subunit 8 [Dermatophagoides pteronyssinus]|uniref:COP9 signalosome complex subunit 8 n=1 Tax=Dermatophagoides pteronyssinus TaxID=6956 RepID=A0ABQ8JH54_DERPT|nr:COP9 signalosome complex subunit 8 [Dermatophagoides pteronyssinus]
MDMISNYKSLVSNLERQELNAAMNGPASPQIYGQLLAIYLLINDLPNAKLLWKRIPNEIKQSNPEIQAVWNVGVKLFKRELSDIYSLVDSVEWPLHLKNIMNCIKEATRNRMLNLIGKAYSYIRLDDVSSFLGYDETQTIEKIHALGWQYDCDTRFVTPKKMPNTMDDSSNSTLDELMIKLTELVSFLEN